jgi:tetraacyldisaccharide 4'-kinase
VSWVYGVIWHLRKWLYAASVLRAERLPVPVLVVGNVYIGGVGKTPITMELARQLALAGWRPGILSRGYGRKSRDTRMVTADSQAIDVGDEPLMIHRIAGLPVAVGSQRADAGRLLLSQHPEVNLLICDDGLQHLALHHDFAVCVFDLRRTGNGWLLPAGPLREPWSGSTRMQDPALWVLSSENPPPPGMWAVTRELDTKAINGRGEHADLNSLPSPLNALAGIAQPHVFFEQLHRQGLTLVQTLSFPDHAPLENWHPNTPGDWLCTTKDAVKIWPQHPEVWAVPLHVQLPCALVKQIDLALHSWISSAHGHETA